MSRACILLALAASSAPAAEPPVTLLVPAYFYPGGESLKDWDRMIAAGGKAKVVAIANPDSGPGKRRDPNYAKAIDRAVAAKVGIVGYVTLSYSERPISAVKADIDSWLHFHPNIQGIFFDEQPSNAKYAPFAAAAFAYARSKIPKGIILSNPGVNCHRDYFDAAGAAVLCAFEHKDGFEKWEPSTWLVRERSLSLVYGVGDDRWRATFDRARTRAEWLLVTDAIDNPWSRLPSYWERLVDAAKQP